jgi:hypothetical protein
MTMAVAGQDAGELDSGGAGPLALLLPRLRLRHMRLCCCLCLCCLRPPLVLLAVLHQQLRALRLAGCLQHRQRALLLPRLAGHVADGHHAAAAHAGRGADHPRKLAHGRRRVHARLAPAVADGAGLAAAGVAAEAQQHAQLLHRGAGRLARRLLQLPQHLQVVLQGGRQLCSRRVTHLCGRALQLDQHQAAALITGPEVAARLRLRQGDDQHQVPGGARTRRHAPWAVLARALPKRRLQAGRRAVAAEQGSSLPARGAAGASSAAAAGHTS